MAPKIPELICSNQNINQPTENTESQPNINEVIPPEILVQIFSLLSESFQDLGHVAQVCKLWNQVSVTSWNCINLENIFPFVSAFKEISDGQVKLPILNIPFPITQKKQIIKIQTSFENILFQAFKRYHVNAKLLASFANAQLRINEENDEGIEPIAKITLYKYMIDRIFNKKRDLTWFFKTVNMNIPEAEVQNQLKQANEDLKNSWSNNELSKNKIVNILINQYPPNFFTSLGVLWDLGISLSKKNSDNINIKALISFVFLKNIEISQCNTILDSLHLNRIITHINNFEKSISIQNGLYIFDYQPLEKDWLSEQNQKDFIQALNQDEVVGFETANELNIGESVIDHSASNPLDNDDGTATDLPNLVTQILAKELPPSEVALFLRGKGAHHSAQFIENLIQQHNLL